MDLTSIEEIFRNLNEANVRYLVVGGLAVVAHGYVRFTADVDIFIDLEPRNVTKAVQVFSDLGYQPRAPVPIVDFIDAETRNSWVRDKNLKVFSLWNPNKSVTEVDLFVEAPMDFNEAAKKSKVFDAGSDLMIHVIGLDDLIHLKLEAGRRKDIDDVENLRNLRDARYDE